MRLGPGLRSDTLEPIVAALDQEVIAGMKSIRTLWQEFDDAKSAPKVLIQELQASVAGAGPGPTAGEPGSAQGLAPDLSDRTGRTAGRDAGPVPSVGGHAARDLAQDVVARPAASLTDDMQAALRRHGLDWPASVVLHAGGLRRSWDLAGRDEQKPPKGDWRTWLLMGGRGSGKTRAGAEWVQALANAPFAKGLRIALVAETLGDAREVMIDGVSGLCRIGGRLGPEVEISRRRLVWRSGAVAQIFSSEDPESLRGPQFHYAWCDELAKWKHAEDTFDMLQFGLRLGEHPRQLVTTTPRPVPLLKRLIADPGTALVRMATRNNAQNMAPGFITALEQRYGGTRLGRQELDGELIEDRTDGLWKRAELEAIVIRFSGVLRRIVVAVDPPAGQGETSCCGIVVAGLEASGRAVVLADCSVEGKSPAGWASEVVKAYRRFAADRVVAEVNQGGEMVAVMLKSIDETLPITTVRATRGKFLRAEPVAALYEQGRVVHAGRFVALEDQMCDFGPDGLSAGRSPDRLDALVWALTALLLEWHGEPRVRGL